ncbi:MULTISPECIES: WXG100 family type VII secretion target [Streptomyces]|uniref:ESAT-6-like protein n=2 Tax=Streptomyces TaxID=1883 RepID=A0A6G3SVR8_STRAQ|nr:MULTISPECIES: WXG100 family type VII secretion target [Streptomyces]NEE05115.1 WXG100 family type VII secretion target [Streptomyces sp. SID7499]NDZ56192.1 WXG100 family type VII secretion target [Streptomyces anulatus]NEB86832.1 WXG100 family type VII secretion target [Streptomyces anulatus]NEC02123.1 WXG100 family type VII secretion target [Streptomyces anulatus]NED28853.1 WXG100 family type VII secretion target [Streptomyces anulatus]
MGNNDGTTVVTYASLDLAAAEIKRQGKQLAEDLEAIRTMIAGVSELWEGEAKRAYADAQERWRTDASAIRDNLNDIAQKVSEASPIYRSGDKRAAANF